MRTLFWILLLGNVILFAIMQRGGSGWGEQPYQPQPALHQDKIRLQDVPRNAAITASPVPASTVLPADVSAQSAASAPVTTVAPAASPAPAVSSATVAKPAPAAKPAPVAVKRNTRTCLEWGDFSGADLKRATELLSALHLGDKLSQRQVEYNKGYWVYIPPLKNKAAAARKVAQLKARGVTEYFVVQEAGALQYAISLGVFKTQDAAQNYLHELRGKGVRSAQVGERASKLKTTAFMLNGVDALTETKLTAMKKDFAGSELRNIPCTLTN